MSMSGVWKIFKGERKKSTRYCGTTGFTQHPSNGVGIFLVARHKQGQGTAGGCALDARIKALTSFDPPKARETARSLGPLRGYSSDRSD
jgi:hypothetical protein